MTNTANTLYLSLDMPDRSKTQLFYAANYFPKRELSEAAARLVCWSSKKMLYKGMVLAALNEEMTTLRYAPSHKQSQEWNIHWAFNAIPTQIEWERKSISFIIECEFRVLVDGTKIVLLSF